MIGVINITCAIIIAEGVYKSSSTHQTAQNARDANKQ